MTHILKLVFCQRYPLPESNEEREIHALHYGLSSLESQNHALDTPENLLARRETAHQVSHWLFATNLSLFGGMQFSESLCWQMLRV